MFILYKCCKQKYGLYLHFPTLLFVFSFYFGFRIRIQHLFDFGICLIQLVTAKSNQFLCFFQILTQLVNIQFIAFNPGYNSFQTFDSLRISFFL